jgi:hypothetical protein
MRSRDCKGFDWQAQTVNQLDQEIPSCLVNSFRQEHLNKERAFQGHPSRRDTQQLLNKALDKEYES